MGSCTFPVTVMKREVVAAEFPLQEHWLPMSNLDLLIPPLDVGVLFCYKKKVLSKEEEDTSLAANSHHGIKTCIVSNIKKALAEALVSFYVFAGEVMQNLHGEPELLCNNRGVDFIQTDVDLDLKDLDLHHPDTSVHGILLPTKMEGVLSVQVNELKCGGIVIGCAFDHRVADAHSANMFFVTWAEISQNKAISHVPYFRRSLLNPRRPIQFDKSIENIHALLSSIPPPKDPVPCDNHFMSCIYYVTAEEINSLQSQASSNGIRRSKLESFSAYLLKIIANGVHDHIKRCRIGIVVDGRGRLNSSGEKTFSMQNYFGNVLSFPSGEALISEVKEMTLSQVSKIVHDCFVNVATEEHFLGLIDWVELHRPEPIVVKDFFNEINDEISFIVSSGQRFPVSKIDFGWGPPDFGSYYFTCGGKTGYVMPMPSVTREGDWVVYMRLRKKDLEFVEKEAGHIFHPLNPTYLKLTC